MSVFSPWRRYCLLGRYGQRNNCPILTWVLFVFTLLWPDIGYSHRFKVSENGIFPHQAVLVCLVNSTCPSTTDHTQHTIAYWYTLKFVTYDPCWYMYILWMAHSARAYKRHSWYKGLDTDSSRMHTTISHVTSTWYRIYLWVATPHKLYVCVHCPLSAHATP